MTKEDVEIEVDLDAAIDELVNPSKAIIVYNDDVNTFDHVIQCFMKYCGHAELQAAQCAMIIHNNQKCDVKHGTYESLKPICEALLENHLTAKIE